MILIISIGNSLRNDDGAGHVLADRLQTFCDARGLPWRRLSVHQLGPEIAAEFADLSPDVALFTDARDCTRPSDSAPGLSLTRLRADAQTAPPLGHHLTPEMLLVYAQALYGVQPDAWLLTAPGYDFGHGERLSAATELALTDADELMATIVLATMPQS